MTAPNLDAFEHKTLVTKPYDLTYSYYVSSSIKSTSNSTQPTLLFVHGFPDDAFMWAGTLAALKAKNRRIIVLDLLGFGFSSKPTEPYKYNYKQQADSIAQILDVENVKDNVIPIGHDWGSATVQRFYLYHRNRCSGLVLLSLAYQIPSPEPFSLDGANKVSTERFSYPQWTYWHFFTAPDAPKIMQADMKRFWEVNNGFLASTVPEEKGRDVWMREMFCTDGAMMDYMLRQGKYKDWTVPLKPYPNGEAELKRFLERFEKAGFEGPVCYYHTLRNNTMLEEEKQLCQAKDRSDQKITVPTLFIGQTGDWVCRTDLMKDAQDLGLVPDLEEKVVDAGHWVMYEKPDEIAACLEEWLVRRFPALKE